MDIHVLDDVTINKIAAGEVIERPASALKELLENSADSGATKIEVTFEEGGKNLIKVVDNGSGIKADQLKLALQRHATSKLQKIEDLFQLSTLGFRGEALASMGAVSELVLSSTPKGANRGSKIQARGGRISEPEPTAPLEGTQVEIKNLFYNVPARQKFLKSTNGETSAIKKVFKNFALAHPEITLTLRQDSKNTAFYSKADFFDRACEVLEMKKSDCFYLSEKLEDELSLEAVLVHPKLNISTMQGLFIFVQTRPVQDKLIQQAVLEGYRNLVMDHQYPQAVIRLNLRPDLVDVNTHPAKLQVKFQDSSKVFRFINQSIKNLFSEKLEQKVNPVAFEDSYFKDSKIDQGIQQTPMLYEPILQYNQKTFSPAETTEADTALRENVTGASTWSSMQVIGQFANTYIVAQSQKGLILIDQHAAHERVLFERLKSKAQIEKQASLLEDLIELSGEAIELLTEKSVQDALETLGFEYHQRGPTTLAVVARPTFLIDTGLQPLFERMAEEMLDSGSHAVMDDVIGNIWATMSCHGAIRAGKVLSKEEMTALLNQMEEQPFSSFCPHGRPVSVLLSQYDLEKLFKRIV